MNYHNALQPILSVVERRNALPILLNVLMTFRENKVSFTTSDIEIQMTSTLIKEDYELKDLEFNCFSKENFLKLVNPYLIIKLLFYL